MVTGRVTRLVLALVILLPCVACDQFSKQLAEEHLKDAGVHSFLGDTLRLVYAENTGAFLGLGQELSAELRFALLIVLTGLLLLLLLGYLIVRWKMARTQFIALILILAGGIGNLIDRATQNGVVVDFLNVGVGTLRSGIFNVADVAVMTGFVVLVFGNLRRSDKTV